MNDTTRVQLFWLSPKGYVHGMQRCSSAVANQMVRVKLTRADFDRKREQRRTCRCARWREEVAR